MAEVLNVISREGRFLSHVQGRRAYCLVLGSPSPLTAAQIAAPFCTQLVLCRPWGLVTERQLTGREVPARQAEPPIN